MPRLPDYTPDLVDKIADMFRDGSTIAQVAALKLGRCRETYYEWKRLYPDFKREAERGECLAQAETERRYNKHFYSGKPFASGYATFMLKNRFRKSYCAEEDATNKNTEAMQELKEAVSKIADEHKKDA